MLNVFRTWHDLFSFCPDLETTPPGMANGVAFREKKLDSLFKLSTNKPVTVLRLTDLLTGSDDIQLGEEEGEEEEPEQPSTPSNVSFTGCIKLKHSFPILHILYVVVFLQLKL